MRTPQVRVDYWLCFWCSTSSEVPFWACRKFYKSSETQHPNLLLSHCPQCVTSTLWSKISAQALAIISAFLPAEERRKEEHIPPFKDSSQKSHKTLPFLLLWSELGHSATISSKRALEIHLLLWRSLGSGRNWWLFFFFSYKKKFIKKIDNM